MDYQIVSGDNGKTIRVNSQGEPVFVQLPAPAAGFKVTIIDDGGFASVNSISIIRNASELIDNIAASTSIQENYGGVSLISDGTNWFRFDSVHVIGLLQSSGRGVFAGGATTAGNSNTQTTIDYITISTLANATSFGSLSSANNSLASCSSTTLGLFGGGYIGSITNAINYVTIATTSGTTSFGTLSSSREILAGCSSQTRGVFGGGYNGSSAQNTIDYVTIQTLANAISFGTLTVARYSVVGCGSPTVGIFGGGYTGSSVSGTIDQITIATIANATSFGSLSTSRDSPGACSNSVRGIFAGGDTTGNDNNTNLMDYITISTASSATSFGNLSANKRELTGCSSMIRGVFAGGGDGTSGSGAQNVTNLIEYVTFATTANSNTFGNLTQSRKALAGCSSSHGGLNG